MWCGIPQKSIVTKDLSRFGREKYVMMDLYLEFLFPENTGALYRRKLVTENEDNPEKGLSVILSMAQKTCSMNGLRKIRATKVKAAFKAKFVMAVELERLIFNA